MTATCTHGKIISSLIIVRYEIDLKKKDSIEIVNKQKNEVQTIQLSDFVNKLIQ